LFVLLVLLAMIEFEVGTEESLFVVRFNAFIERMK
jgi:hypothetical protein